VSAPRLAYACFMLLAIGAFVLAQRLLPRNPEVARLSFGQRMALGLAAFIGGTLGAKLPFVLVAPNGIIAWEAWFTDGKTIVAGLIGAYIAVEVTKLATGIRAKTGDSFAVPLAFAMAVGRWGCFCNGCCYGVPTDLPWAVSFEQRDGSVALCHPTQIYESIFHLTMAGVLVWLTLSDRLPRQRLKLYLISYGVYRFLTEFIRPEPQWVLGMTFYQWAALVLIAGLAIQWQFDRRPGPISLAAAI